MQERQIDKGKSGGKERLIQAAQSLAQKNSFDEITIDEIVKVADLSRPAFYYHFTGGKDELRLELVRRGYLTDAPAQDTRQMMLDAALRVFARSGFSSATLDEIAAEASVSRGTLCWHFHNKDDLLETIIEHSGVYAPLRLTIEKIEQELCNGVALDDETVFKRIAGGFYDSFTAQQSDLTRLPVLLLYTHPQAAQLLANKIARGRKGITEYVKRRQEEGYFRKNIDPALFVQVLAMTFVMRAIGRGLNDLLPFAHLSREETIDQLVLLLLYGMALHDQPPQDQAEV